MDHAVICFKRKGHVLGIILIRFCGIIVMHAKKGPQGDVLILLTVFLEMLHHQWQLDQLIHFSGGHQEDGKQ